MRIIIKNYLKNLKNDKAHYIFIGFPLIISFCVGLTLKDKMFDVYADTRSRLFAIVCIAIWIGLFNSVLEICKERSSFKMDLRSGFKASELFLSRFLVHGVICLFQTIIIFAICTLFVDFPKEGAVIGISSIEYILSIFLITFSADIMGFLISSLCPSNDIANRSLPFILMVQFIFSGQLFELGDTLDKVSKFTISKWGMELLGSIGDITNLDLGMLPSLESNIYDAFEHSAEHVIVLWGILILFIVIFSVLSIFFINRIKFDKK